jgi:prolyl-tRNA synthetase
VSTRLVGGLVMTHGDDAGLVIPPKLAPIQAVIVPIYRKDEEREIVLSKAGEVAAALKDRGLRAHIDARANLKPGAKYFEWERKGVPLRIEIGPRDIEQGHVMLVPRVAGDGPRKEPIGESAIADVIAERLGTFQTQLLETARKRREDNSHRGITDYGTFSEIIEGSGGFVYAGWCGSEKCEERVKTETKATIRVLPDAEFRSAEVPSKCLVCGEQAGHEAVWARAY